MSKKDREKQDLLKLAEEVTKTRESAIQACLTNNTAAREICTQWSSQIDALAAKNADAADRIAGVDWILSPTGSIFESTTERKLDELGRAKQKRDLARDLKR